MLIGLNRKGSAATEYTVILLLILAIALIIFWRSLVPTIIGQMETAGMITPATATKLKKKVSKQPAAGSQSADQEEEAGESPALGKSDRSGGSSLSGPLFTPPRRSTSVFVR